MGRSCQARLSCFKTWGGCDVERLYTRWSAGVLVNSYHCPLPTAYNVRGQWIEANAKLITQMGSKGYMRLLRLAGPCNHAAI